jgi:imidazolonepropionase-like amidohydrolase
MRRMMLLVLLLLILIPIADAADRHAIKAARAIDGVSGEPLRDAVILVEDGVISAVGTEIDVPDGFEIIDLGDATE